MRKWEIIIEKVNALKIDLNVLVHVYTLEEMHTSKCSFIYRIKFKLSVNLEYTNICRYTSRNSRPVEGEAVLLWAAPTQCRRVAQPRAEAADASEWHAAPRPSSRRARAAPSAAPRAPASQTSGGPPARIELYPHMYLQLVSTSM